MDIDKESSKPIYLQIKDQLIENIEQGIYKPGDKIPSARELVRRFHVSRMTVLQALRELISQRRLFTVVGKGTFVGQPEKLETDLKVVWGFTETFRSEGYKINSQLLYFGVVFGDRTITENLKINEKTPLYCLTRKRLLNDLPVGVETVFLIQSDVPGIDRFDWSKESLYTILREQYGLDLVCGYNYIEAAAADESTAHILSIPRNFPVLATERTSCLIDQRPIEYVRAFYRADRMRLRVDMTAVKPVKLNTKIDSSFSE